MKHLFIILSLFLGMSMSAQTDIADMRANYDIDDEVTVTGIVTNDGGLGSVRYIQDGTAGIAIYPGLDWTSWTFEPAMGDEITVTGIITEFNGLLEIGPSLSEVTLNSSGNPLPDAQLITASEMAEDLEAQLVYVQNAVFDNAGVTIDGNNTYVFNADGESGIIYVRTGNPLVGTLLPFGENTVTGIVSQFDQNGDGTGYQLLPRFEADFVPSSAINFASIVEQENLATTSFDLSWETDNESDTKIEYGLTPALGSEVYISESVTDHMVTLTDLEPGTIYYARATSVSGEDEAISNIKPYATVSNSSGDIIVYFNDSVDNSVATEENAISLGADLNDTLAAYITRAQFSLDIAVYNINNSVVVDAINEAQEAGVAIRYIAEASNANIGIGDFNAGIPVHYREDGLGSGMHNKFCIIDADHEELAHLITGSTNWTTNNLVDDPNNMIIFQDQSLARGYRIEFNEMWGSDTDTPDADNARFGADKLVDTPLKYIIGGSPVEVYFSPSDGTTRAIENVILSSEYDFYFSTLVFTRDELGDAVLEIDESIFIDVKGCIEQTNNQGSEWDDFLAADMDVVSHQDVEGQLHHKYGISDQSQPTADPMVVTGSHNWSSSAETTNDENVVVVHDARVANLYYQEFIARFNEVDVSVYEEQSVVLNAYPVPAQSALNIEFDQSFIGNQARFYDLSGKEVMTFNVSSNRMTIPLSNVSSGTYIMKIDGSTNVLKVIKK